MDQSKFQEGQSAYDAGDYRTAAKAFLLAAGKNPAGNGMAFHKAGNALMRLRRYSDAVTVYGHALRDDAYDKRGPVFANLGQALAAMGEYAQAVTAYQSALQEPGYATPWKAWQGAAAALLERGKVEEAAVAYRKAAIEPGNPDPAKALVNLGLCFMGLQRPADAAEAYKAALGFDAYKGRGKALANLGIAYTQTGDYEEAVRAFEKATQLHSHALTEAAQQAYQTALSMVRPPAQTVEGWETGDLVAVRDTLEMSGGWDTGAFAAIGGSTDVPVYSHHAEDVGNYPGLNIGDESAVADFFELTEEEMKQRDREQRRKLRYSASGRKAMMRRVAGFVVFVAIVLGALAVAYSLGYGFPAQSTTVNGLLGAYKSGGEVRDFWVGAPDKDVDKEMAKMPPVKKFSLDWVQRGRSVSTVGITVTPQQGAALHFKVSLAREGVGWKVTGIENDWRSTGS